MAIYTFKNGFVSFAAQNVSDDVRSVTLDTGNESNDKTAMGSNTRVSKAGLATWSVSIEFNQDFAASHLDALIAGLSDSEAALIFRSDAGSIGPTNPQWSGTGVVTAYNPISGATGDLAVATVTLAAASDLTRATS
jgi:hypothetical protein